MRSTPPSQKLFEINGKNITANWKVVLPLIVAMVGGTSGYASWRLVSYAEAKEMLSEVELKSNKKHESLSNEVEQNTKTLKTVSDIVLDVQETQHDDIAIREARRLVESIYCKKWDTQCELKKDQTRERIRRTNKKRLKRKQELCATIDCAN